MSINVVRFFTKSATRPAFRQLIRYGMRPRFQSRNIFRPVDRTKFMPRLFRRGYGVGGLVRRRPRRRFGRKVYRKKTQNKVHTYTRWCDKDTTYVTPQLGPNTIVETGAEQHLTYQFKLDNLSSPSDFTNLYDMYRINKIMLYLERQTPPNASQFMTGLPNKKIRVVHDYNDAAPLTDEDQYLQYSNCKSYSANKNIAITLYPKINNAVENAGGSANAFTSMSSNRVWLSCEDDVVPHFGLKIFIPTKLAVTPDDIIYKVRAKMWLSFKNSK